MMSEVEVIPPPYDDEMHRHSTTTTQGPDRQLSSCPSECNSTATQTRHLQSEATFLLHFTLAIARYNSSNQKEIPEHDRISIYLFTEVWLMLIRFARNYRRYYDVLIKLFEQNHRRKALLCKLT
jgi:hypothetical protein